MVARQKNVSGCAANFLRGEREAFDIDGVIDRIAKTIVLTVK